MAARRPWDDPTAPSGDKVGPLSARPGRPFDEIPPTEMRGPDAVAVVAGHLFVDEKPAISEFADSAPRPTRARVIAMFTGQEDQP
jgi:hypothetical protein